MTLRFDIPCLIEESPVDEDEAESSSDECPFVVVDQEEDSFEIIL